MDFILKLHQLNQSALSFIPLCERSDVTLKKKSI